MPACFGLKDFHDLLCKVLQSHIEIECIASLLEAHADKCMSTFSKETRNK